MALLEARDLTIRFGGVLALDAVSFDVEAGQIFGVIGPNGAGKTTLLNAISSVYKLDAGHLRFDGHDVTNMASHHLSRLGVARTFQIVQPFNHMSVRENVAVGAMYGHARLRQRSEYLDAADEALQRTGLIAKADFMPPHLTLSDRKRLEVARALAMKPRLLLLDEVMAGLNLTEIERTIELVRDISAAGITVIVIEHVMKAVLALCDRAVVLNFGRKLTEGKPHDVVNEPAVVEAYLGTRFAKSRGEWGMSLLSVDKLVVSYGDSQVLIDVGFDLQEGEIVALVGANGAGKTTLLRTLTGLMAPRSGTMVFDGRPILNVPPYERARLGLAMVPEGRRLFQGLTVRQNLELGSRAAPDTSHKVGDIEFVFGLFPELVRLQGRLSGLLSGGEQQMCAIGRALMARPKMLLIDEMSLGLAPVIVERIAGVIRTINSDRGVSILLVEQDVGLALDIATRGYVLDTGRIIIDGPSKDLLLRDDIRTAYLGLH